jgi:hypothetical protein
MNAVAERRLAVMTARRDVLVWVGAALVLIGIAWLGPLMFDQLTFFGDQEQEADAEAARSLMWLPALLLAAGAGALAMSGRMLHAAIAALPLAAVALAWTTPDALYQLLAYGITAPIVIGALLATMVPLGHAAPGPLVLGVIVIATALAILATPVLGGLAVLTLLTWWQLSGPAGVRWGHRR